VRLELISKNLAIGTILLLVSFIASIAFITTISSTFQSINPTATVAAISVVIIGIVWFRRTVKS
jgi:hypothetical protein